MKELQDKQSRLDYLWENYGDGKLDEQLDELKEEVGEQLTTISDKVEKIEEKLNPTTPEELQAIEDQYSYGIRWKKNSLDPVVERVGNSELHKALPVQNSMRGVIATYIIDGQIKGYDSLYKNDWNLSDDYVTCTDYLDAYCIVYSTNVSPTRVDGNNYYFDLPYGYSVGDEVIIKNISNGQTQYENTVCKIGEQKHQNSNWGGPQIFYFYPLIIKETGRNFNLGSENATFDIHKKVDLSDKDIFVYVPEFYYKLKETDNYNEIRISYNRDILAIDGWKKCGESFVSAYYLSTYYTDNGEVIAQSRSGAYPTEYISGLYMAKFDFDIQKYNLIFCWLPIIEFGTFKFTKYQEYQEGTKNGYGDSLGDNTGEFQIGDTGNIGFKYRGIEYLYSANVIADYSRDESVAYNDKNIVFSHNDKRLILPKKDFPIKGNIQEIDLETTFPIKSNQEQNTGKTSSFTGEEEALLTTRGGCDSPLSWYIGGPYPIFGRIVI